MNDAPVLDGVPTTVTALVTGVATDLANFTVADVDDSTLTVTLTTVNGTLSGLTNANSTLAGFQLSGTAAAINSALAAAQFAATAAGEARVDISIDDSHTTTSGSYAFKATNSNTAPTLSTLGSARSITTGAADSLSYISVTDPDTDQTLQASLTISERVTGTPDGKIFGLKDTDSSTPGFQIKGSVTEINAALAAASFKASSDGSVTLNLTVTDGVVSSPVSGSYSLTASNALPTLTTVSTLTGAEEDTTYNLDFATLAAAANEADLGGSVTGFRITDIDSSKG